MALNRFEKYKFLKSKFTCNYKGIPLEKVLSYDLLLYTYSLDYIRKIDDHKYSLKEVLRSLVIDVPVKFLNKYFYSNKVLFSIYINRKDYQELVDCTIETIDCDSQVLKFFKHYPLSYNHNLKGGVRINIVNIIHSFFLAIKVVKNMPFNHFLHFWIIITFYKNLINKLSRKFSKPELPGFVSFNSAIGPDALVSLFLKGKSVPTYSLQHGVYVGFKEYVPLDVINYENVTADKLLCWGASTQRFVSKWMSSSRLTLAGNPKYSNNVVKAVDQTFTKGLIILSRFEYHEGNVKLLNELSQVKDISFDVKLHPSLNYSFYLDLCSKLKLNIVSESITLKELFEGRDYNFSICYNTSSYYESLLYGMLSFRYCYKENEEFVGLNDKFESAEELKQLIFEFKNHNARNLVKEVETLLVDVLGLGINNYANIIRC